MKTNILLAFLIQMLLSHLLFADTITLNGGEEEEGVTTLTSAQAVSGSIARDEEKHYKIEMLKGQSLNTLLDNLTADNDLYVKMGSVAAKRSFDCKSAKGGTQDDSCSVTATQNTTAYITIIGFRAGDYRVTATLNGGKEGVTTLTSAQAVSGSVARDEERHYKIEMLEGQSLNALLDNLTADNDLYVKMGSVAAKRSFDCKSAKGGTQDDSCSVTATQNTTAYITIIGFRAGDYRLTATITNNGEEDPNDLNISSSVTEGETKFYTLLALENQTIHTILNELSDDADLYVRVGSRPDGANYDCKSTRGGTNDEKCSLFVSEDATVHIAVYGYKAANYTLVTSRTDGGGEGVVELTSDQPLSSSVSQREEKHYKINISRGQSLNTLLDDLTANNDLYVKLGSVATIDSFTCKSTKSGTQSDECSTIAEQNTTAYITVVGVEDANYTVTATVTDVINEDVTTLIDSEPQAGSVVRDDLKYYKISGESGKKITATISELSADADLYIKVGSKPTTSSFDCKSTHGGTTSDSCSVNLSDNREVYIAVFGFRTTNYNLVATVSNKEEVPLIPANPEVPTVLEDAEGGTLNPNWITARGDKPGYIFPTPDIPGAPEGTGVMVHHANADGASKFRYELPINNTSQRVLSMDCGGLPTHRFENQDDDHLGYIVHHSVGVVVETRLGERIMNWDSWYNHQGYGPRKNDNGHNVFLNYPTPVEMVSGYYKPVEEWTHFEVNLDDSLHMLEPENEIIRIVQFFTTGGFLDNITLSQAQ